MTKKMPVKRLLLLAACLIAGVFISYHGISAYLADADRANNTLTIGSVVTKVVEDYDPPGDVTPGTSFKKTVSIKNTGDSVCYTRIRVLFSDSRMEQYCTLDYNDTGDWTYNSGDGYWYYTKALKKGETTSALFKTVTVNASAPESEMQSIDILVYSESCQKGNKDSYTGAWQHFLRNQ